MWSNQNGPRPVRDRQWPLGFPWLQARLKEKAEGGTTLAFFSAAVLEAAQHTRGAVSPAAGLLEHPEDFGATQAGVPASIWQLS